MSIGTLWSIECLGKNRIIKATAALAGLKITLGDYMHTVTNVTPEYISNFHGRIPAFETKEGLVLFEAMAIARYVAGLAPAAGLLGHSPEEIALVQQWGYLAETEVSDYTDLITDLLYGVIPYNKPLHTELVERQLTTLKILNAHLATRTFFVGERITLADITVASAIWYAVGVTFDAPLRAQLPHLIRHMETVTNQPQLYFIIYPDPVYAEKAKQYTPPPKEKKEKEPAVAAPQAPKAKKPKKEDDDDEDEDP